MVQRVATHALKAELVYGEQVAHDGGKTQPRSAHDQDLKTRRARSTLSHNSSSTMPVVLPGEIVPASHVNLKLGPGLSQTPSSTVLSTRAGDLQHSANNARWWVENNSARRVRFPRVMHRL